MQETLLPPVITEAEINKKGYDGPMQLTQIPPNLPYHKEEATFPFT